MVDPHKPPSPMNATFLRVLPEPYTKLSRVQRLENATRDMDVVSQAALSRIALLASSAALALACDHDAWERSGLPGSRLDWAGQLLRDIQQVVGQAQVGISTAALGNGCRFLWTDADQQQ